VAYIHRRNNNVVLGINCGIRVFWYEHTWYTLILFTAFDSDVYVGVTDYKSIDKTIKEITCIYWL
jgi:hypothetical protein